MKSKIACVSIQLLALFGMTHTYGAIHLAYLCEKYGVASFEAELKNVENIKEPTIGEYVALQSALHRDLLAPFPSGNDPDKKYFRLKQRFQFITPEREPAVVKAAGTGDACIVSYCSLNEPYVSWLEELPKQLVAIGYQGAFLGRIGGWPNLEGGDLVLADVPYAFKVCAIREAIREKHTKVLWVDTALSPRKDLSKIFEVLDRYGYFAVSTGVSLQRLYDKGDFDIELLSILDVTPAQLRFIPHVQGGVIGINAGHPRGEEILSMWHAWTEKKEAYVSGYPEEVVLSVILYKLGHPPILQNSTMWQEDTNSEKGRDPYFILRTLRPE